MKWIYIHTDKKVIISTKTYIWLHVVAGWQVRVGTGKHSAICWGRNEVAARLIFRWAGERATRERNTPVSLRIGSSAGGEDTKEDGA
jgi:hypothetical protein